MEKELADDDSTKAVEALGNPDFLFQVLDADNDSQFLPGNWAYSLYDADGSVIQEIEVTEKYQDGRVKTMKIKDGAGNVLCTEEYDSDGNRTSQTGSGLNKVLRLGANGIFALKAGQKAEFVGIPETWGKYYVRELLEQTTAGQYGTITVSGTAITPETITVGGTAYSGVKSPVLDITVTRQLKKDNPRIKSCRWALAPLQEFKTKRVLWTELETACGCLAQASKASGAALSLAHLQPFDYLMFNWISAAETEKVTWTCIQEHH